MKFVVKNDRTYVRHWFRWYFLDGFLVMKLKFKDDDDE